MRKLYDRIVHQWRDSASFVLGVWLLASPYALGFTDVTWAAWNAIALGAIIAVSALAALVAFHEWEEWVSGILGLWLIASPWVLGFSTLALATWNHVIVGLLVTAMAAWTIRRHRGFNETQRA